MKSKIIVTEKWWTETAKNGNPVHKCKIKFEDGNSGTVSVWNEADKAFVVPSNEVEYTISDDQFKNIKIVVPKKQGAFAPRPPDTSGARAQIAVAAYQITMDALIAERITRDEFMDKLNGHAAVITKLYKSINL